jgi:hypothetical protein
MYLITFMLIMHISGSTPEELMQMCPSAARIAPNKSGHRRASPCHLVCAFPAKVYFATSKQLSHGS